MKFSSVTFSSLLPKRSQTLARFIPGNREKSAKHIHNFGFIFVNKLRFQLSRESLKLSSVKAAIFFFLSQPVLSELNFSPREGGLEAKERRGEEEKQTKLNFIGTCFLMRKTWNGNCYLNIFIVSLPGHQFWWKQRQGVRDAAQSDVYLHLLIAEREYCCWWQETDDGARKDEDAGPHGPVELSHAWRSVLAAVASLGTGQALEGVQIVEQRSFALRTRWNNWKQA